MNHICRKVVGKEKYEVITNFEFKLHAKKGYR